MKYFLSVFSIFLLTSIPGCSGSPDDLPEIGSVSGTITVDKQPKEGLQVQFQPTGEEGGRPSVGTTDDSGYYSLRYSKDEDGAKVGPGYITITSSPPDCGGCCGEEEGFVDPIPPQYNAGAANNPDMQKEVKPGSNTFDFDIDTSIREDAPQQGGGGDQSGCCCS